MIDRKPSHRRFRLDPPHTPNTIYWVAEGSISGDSRTEHISVSREWYWRSMKKED